LSHSNMASNALFFTKRLPMLQEKARESSQRRKDMRPKRISWFDLTDLPAEGHVDLAIPPSPGTEAELPLFASQDAAEAATLLMPRVQTPRRASKHSIRRASTDDTLVSWSSETPCWEQALPMLRLASDDEVKSAREQTLQKQIPLAQWDILTLRQWFNIMDVDRDGSITKHDWLGFLDKHPKFRDVWLGDCGQTVKNRFSRTGSTELRNQAFRIKQVTAFWKDVFGNSETLKFEEFVELFRRAGHLVEYQNDANPRVQMADLLGDLHKRDEAVVSDVEARQMGQLAKQNLQGWCLKEVERNMMSQSPKNSASSRDTLRDIMRPHSALGSRIHRTTPRRNAGSSTLRVR